MNMDEDLKNQIYDLYINKNYRKPDVAQELHISKHVLSKYLQHFFIKKDMAAQVALRKQTNLLRYGADNPSKNFAIKKRIGEANHLNKEARVTKIKNTKKEKYGNSNYNNMEKIVGPKKRAMAIQTTITEINIRIPWCVNMV